MRNGNDFAIDPLSLILSNSLYVTLHLPDPPPDVNPHADIEARVAAMTVDERRRALARVESMRAMLDATAAAIKRVDAAGRER